MNTAIQPLTDQQAAIISAIAQATQGGLRNDHQTENPLMDIKTWGQPKPSTRTRGRPSTTAIAILETLTQADDWVELTTLLQHGTYPAVMSAIHRLNHLGLIKRHPANKHPDQPARYAIKD